MKRIVLLFLLFFITACSNANNTMVTPTLTVTVAFNPTSTPKPLESPTPSIKPEYQSLQTLLDAQEVPYTIQNGIIVIDDASTPAQESIILSPESGKVNETNDGLTKNVVTAVDKDKNRMVFVEGYGWVKDVNTSESSLQNRIKIPFGWTKDNSKVLNTALNTIVSLHYAENPTIPADALDPHDWIDVNYYGGPVFFLSFRPLNGREVDPEYNTNEARKSFVWSGVFETTTPNDQQIIILAQTRKNSVPENPNQLINLFAAFDKAAYEKYVQEQGATNVVDYTVNNNEQILALVFSPPVGYDWAGGNLSFAKGYPNPTVAELYKQGEIFSLLRSEDQQAIISNSSCYLALKVHEVSATVAVTTPKLEPRPSWTTRL